MVPKDLEKKLEELEIREKNQDFQDHSTVLDQLRYLEGSLKLEKTCSLSDSSERPLVKPDVRN